MPYCEHNNNVLLKMRDHRISDKAYGNRKGFINTVTNLLNHFYITIFAVSDIEYYKLKLHTKKFWSHFETTGVWPQIKLS